MTKNRINLEKSLRYIIIKLLEIKTNNFAFLDILGFVIGDLKLI